jgi:hypothetical protein
MKLRHKLANAWRNLVCFSQLDYKRALSDMLAMGRRLEHDAPNDLRHCPVCEAELQRTTRLNGEIVSFCPRWQFHPAETQPRVRQVPFPDQERFTDKVQRPGYFSVAVHQHLQQGAGMDTAISRAIPKPKFPRPQ